MRHELACLGFSDRLCSQEWCGFAGGNGGCKPDTPMTAHCPDCERPWSEHDLNGCPSRKANP